MKIKFHNKFEKQYKKLPNNLKEKTKKVIQVFSESPNHPALKNHPLKGRLKGQRAITVTEDIRIVFIKEDKYIVVIFLTVTGHHGYK